MSATTREGTSATSLFPPAWPTSSGEDGCGIITGSRKVEFAAIEIDGRAGLTVGAHLLHTIVVNDTSVVIDPGAPENEITRKAPDGEPDRPQIPLVFEVAGARRVVTALLERRGAVEHAKATL
jgi:hypothetical protein